MNIWQRLPWGLVLVATAFLFCGTTASGEEPAKRGEEAAQALTLSDPQTYRLLVTLELSSPNASARAIFAAAPVPRDWPEQTVKLVEERKPAGVTTKVVHVAGKADILTCSLQGIDSGGTVRVERLYEITRHRARTTINLTQSRVPAPLKPEFREFIASAPGVETANAKIKAAHAAVHRADLSAGEQARRHFDWVRSKLKFESGPFRGALKTLESKAGDCEDFTALFVAFCRLSGIPARTVWIEEHAYAEIYLEDDDAAGWVPCELVGAGGFGFSRDRRPILQKGDEIPDPITRRPQHYVMQGVKGIGGPVGLVSKRTILPVVATP